MFRKESTLVAIVCAFSACSLQGGEGDIYGDLYNAPGGKVLVVDGQNCNVFGRLQNFGTIYIFDSFWAQREVQNSGLIEMLGFWCSGEQGVRNAATGIVKGCGLIGSKSSSIDNRGLIWSVGGSLLLYSWDDPKRVGMSNTGILRNSPGTSLTAWVLVPNVGNQGTIEINADGAVVFDCNLTNEPNALINLLGGTLSAKTIIQKAGATLEGFGGVTGNLAIDPNAIVTLAGPTNIVGDVTIAKGATLEIRDSTIWVTGKVICNGTIHLKSGDMIPQGGLSGDYHIIREPSIYSGVGQANPQPRP